MKERRRDYCPLFYIFISFFSYFFHLLICFDISKNNSSIFFVFFFFLFFVDLFIFCFVLFAFFFFLAATRAERLRVEKLRAKLDDKVKRNKTKKRMRMNGDRKERDEFLLFVCFLMHLSQFIIFLYLSHIFFISICSVLCYSSVFLPLLLFIYIYSD